MAGMHFLTGGSPHTMKIVLAGYYDGNLYLSSKPLFPNHT